ncbi:hypothetical protein EBZ57_02870 [bacterium]|nr:hypothetical protein [bacterium]
MAKQNYGECTGKCPVCTINLWSSTGGKPVIFPCNIEKCPYEHPKKQNRHLGQHLLSPTGSGLAQIE